MFDRRLLYSFLLTIAVAVYIFWLDRMSTSRFDRYLEVGLCIALILVIWSKILREHRARLVASNPCFMGAFFVHFLVKCGPSDLGTIIGGAGFLIGLILLVQKLRSKAEPDEKETD